MSAELRDQLQVLPTCSTDMVGEQTKLQKLNDQSFELHWFFLRPKVVLLHPLFSLYIDKNLFCRRCRVGFFRQLTCIFFQRGSECGNHVVAFQDNNLFFILVPAMTNFSQTPLLVLIPHSPLSVVVLFGLVKLDGNNAAVFHVDLAWRRERKELALLFLSGFHLKHNTSQDHEQFVSLASSGTARIPVNPLRKAIVTRDAPQRRAEVAQSIAVSPAPRTTTRPRIVGSGLRLHPHIPEKVQTEIKQAANCTWFAGSSYQWEIVFTGVESIFNCESFKKWINLWLWVSDPNKNGGSSLFLNNQISNQVWLFPLTFSLVSVMSLVLRERLVSILIPTSLASWISKSTTSYGSLNCGISADESPPI